MLWGGNVDDDSEITITCVFCEGADLFDLEASIASTFWPVCKLCAGAGRALLEEGVLQAVPDCLHMVAMEIERFGEGYAIPEDRPSMKWLYRLKRNFSRGTFRQICPCDKCMFGDAGVTFSDLGDDFGVESETWADTMPLQMLRGMKPGAKLKASDGSVWTPIDEIARRMVANSLATKAPAVGPLAQAARPTVAGEWVDSWNPATGEVAQAYLPVDQLARDVRDAKAKAYWARFVLDRRSK